VRQSGHLSFVQVRPFSRAWDGLGLTDADLIALEGLLMEDPERGTVVRNTGGVRKARFAPPGWNVGRSGALRVYYGLFPWASMVLLLAVHTKAAASTLTAAEERAVRGLMESFERALRASIGPSRSR
jgi:hypothetical protein